MVANRLVFVCIIESMHNPPDKKVFTDFSTAVPKVTKKTVMLFILGIVVLLFSTITIAYVYVAHPQFVSAILSATYNYLQP